jgi:hypothetical protein
MCGLGVTCENFQWGWLGLYIGIDVDEDAIGPNKVGNDTISNSLPSGFFILNFLAK